MCSASRTRRHAASAWLASRRGAESTEQSARGYRYGGQRLISHTRAATGNFEAGRGIFLREEVDRAMQPTRLVLLAGGMGSRVGGGARPKALGGARGDQVG